MVLNVELWMIDFDVLLVKCSDFVSVFVSLMKANRLTNYDETFERDILYHLFFATLIIIIKYIYCVNGSVQHGKII